MLLQEADRQPHDRRRTGRRPSADSDRRAAAPRARALASATTATSPTSFEVTTLARSGAVGHVATRRFGSGSSSSSGFEFALLYQRACRRGSRVLDCRAGTRRDSRRDAAGAGGGRGRRPRAVQRHQPRHRGAGVSGPRAGERARADARAVSGRRVSRAGEVRLRQRRHRRARPARVCEGRRVFALYPASDALRRAGARGARSCPTTCRRSARCWRRTSRPRSTASGTRGRTSAIASPSSAAARSAVWSPGSPDASPGATSSSSTSTRSAPSIARALGVRFAAPASASDERRRRHSRERLGRRASRSRFDSPRSRRRSSR